MIRVAGLKKSGGRRADLSPTACRRRAVEDDSAHTLRWSRSRRVSCARRLFRSCARMTRDRSRTPRSRLRARALNDYFTKTIYPCSRRRRLTRAPVSLYPEPEPQPRADVQPLPSTASPSLTGKVEAAFRARADTAARGRLVPSKRAARASPSHRGDRGQCSGTSGACTRGRVTRSAYTRRRCRDTRGRGARSAPDDAADAAQAPFRLGRAA